MPILTRKKREVLSFGDLELADSSRWKLNTLRTESFKLFKRPFPGFLKILTL